MSWSSEKLTTIKEFIQQQAKALGFQDMRITDTITDSYFERYQQWINNGKHGEMSYLARNLQMRRYPQQLVAETLRILSFRYDYLPENAKFTTPLSNPNLANISRYALGRDYHKLMRKKLANLTKILQTHFELTETLVSRVFVDSAPVMETCFAEKSGIGWKGKHTLVINKQAGSWFFLGEIFLNIPLDVDLPVEPSCGNCTACINLCPTGAIESANFVNASKCISYLTIENNGAIPIELREQVGNRIYGCDDCQLACPWNRYAEISKEQDFQVRNQLDNISLIDLWKWSEIEFLNKLEGSPIRRIGYQNWLRNLAVALGNSEFTEDKIYLLESKKQDANDIVTEHINWAISQLNARRNQIRIIDIKTKKLLNCVIAMLPRDA